MTREELIETMNYVLRYGYWNTAKDLLNRYIPDAEDLDPTMLWFSDKYTPTTEQGGRSVMLDKQWSMITDKRKIIVRNPVLSEFTIENLPIEAIESD